MSERIQKTEAFVKHQLRNAEAGHDWFHIERVWKNARLILESEPANREVVELAALLHDIADSKFHDGNEELGPQLAEEFLQSIETDPAVTKHVVDIIRHMSFKSSFGAIGFNSIEMQIVQDADRLDAIGAIGIARAFHYGGFKNRTIYDPAIAPEQHLSADSYKKSSAPTINHFYEKLLLLKDKMNTLTGKALAGRRHQFMIQFLEEFYGEWNGEF